MARRSRDAGLPVGSRGRAPVGVLDEVPQELKQNVKLVYNFQRFPVENLGFNEYRSKAWTIYFANTVSKNSEDSIGGGEFERPLWVRRWPYLKLQQEWIAG